MNISTNIRDSLFERGPYWIDGILPLTYIMDNSLLKQKVQSWVEWALQSQHSDIFFGPSSSYPPKKDYNCDLEWLFLKFLKILFGN